MDFGIILFADIVLSLIILIVYAIHHISNQERTTEIITQNKILSDNISALYIQINDLNKEISFVSKENLVLKHEVEMLNVRLESVKGFLD